MKYLTIIAIILSLVSVGFSYKLMGIQEQLAIDLFELSTNQLGATITSTATSDTLETFRTNVNASLTSLRDDNVSTTTAYTWTATQTFSAGVGTSLGIASTSPFGTLGIGSASATSTISGGKFCAYFKDDAGRNMWITLATSGNTVFATSTTKCNN